MKQYRTKSQTYEAVHYTGENLQEILDFMGEKECILEDRFDVENYIILDTNFLVYKGDWVIKNFIRPEFFTISDKLFKSNFDEVIIKKLRYEN